MADRTGLANVHGRLSDLSREGSSSRRRISPSPLRPIKVVERPGARFDAPPHGYLDLDCWCEPDTIEYAETVAIIHRCFEH